MTANLPLIQFLRSKSHTELANELEEGSQVLATYAEQFDRAWCKMREDWGVEIPILATIETRRMSMVRPLSDIVLLTHKR